MIANEGWFSHRYPHRNINELIRRVNEEMGIGDYKRSLLGEGSLYALSILLAILFQRISLWWFLGYFYLSKDELLKIRKIIIFRVCCFFSLFVFIFFFLSFLLKRRSIFFVLLKTEFFLFCWFSRFLLCYPVPALDRKYLILRKNSKTKGKKPEQKEYTGLK